MRWNRSTLPALLAFATLAAAVGASCTLVTNFSECEVDSDCHAKYGPRATCSEQVCDVPTGRDDVTTEHCQEIIGDLESDTFLIGVLLPLTGVEAGFGIPLLNAIETALTNFSSLEVDDGRNVALLVCDTQGENDVALEAAEQAVNQGRVTALIGPDFSSQTIEIAQEVAIPNEVLLVSPSATSVQITNLDDKNLVWRTSPSDESQAEALAQLVTEFIARDSPKTLEETTAWVLHAEGDAYGTGLQESLVELFPDTLNQSLTVAAYPEQWEEWFTESAAGFDPPDVVVLLGAAESWDIAEAIDETFDTTPTFFFADAPRNPAEAELTDPSLEGRILGTAPQNVGDVSYTPYTQFRLKYRTDHDEEPNELQFVANAYDALHVVVLAAAGGGGIEGPELARGMAKLSSGEEVSANSQGASRAISILRDGGTVDFQGASGRLDFDESGDPSASKIVLWCFRDGGVPEAGVLLSIDGEFSYQTCAGEVVEPSDDMGTMEPDMGTTDPDLGTAEPDMGAMIQPDMVTDVG